MNGERLFSRLPRETRPGDVVTLSDGRRAEVETAKLADDLRDTKCVVVVLPQEGRLSPGHNEKGT